MVGTEIRALGCWLECLQAMNFVLAGRRIHQFHAMTEASNAEPHKVYVVRLDRDRNHFFLAEKRKIPIEIQNRWTRAWLHGKAHVPRRGLIGKVTAIGERGEADTVCTVTVRWPTGSDRP